MAPADTALLRIDIQLGFCPGGNLAVPKGDEIVPVVNALSPHFRIKIDTQDWHPEGHSSFASTHGKKPLESIEMPYGTQTLWPDHCVQGTNDALIHPELHVGARDILVRKGMNKAIDSYSAFYENDHKTSPEVVGDGRGLSEYLKLLGVKRLVLTGLALDFCVAWNAMDAVKEGFKVFVVKDATRGIGIPQGDKTTIDLRTEEMIRAGVTITTAADLPAALGIKPPAPAFHP
jgi:nicotinamidase/pyrazinamidase